ncbi:MAG: hypothetical protein KGK34_13150 [Chloroflexota bacterium]|nr:hypothetical protein [Chloroflexota bacterium]
MAKVVIHIFHGDEPSLGTGSHVSERIRQVQRDRGIDIEVYVFGPAEKALLDPTAREFNKQIDELVAKGVQVKTCLNIAAAEHATETLAARGIQLELAREAFTRYALEGATVISF